MKRKFIIAVGVTLTLWLVVISQTLITKWYVSEPDFIQAFSRNHLTVKGKNEGELPGKLDGKEMQELADDLFASLGGGRLFDSDIEENDNFYVAYGYTSGIENTKKVNGRKINLNVAITYDEKADCTNVTMDSPLILTDF